MVYESYQISLFEKNDPIPKMLVTIKKRSQELFALVKQQKSEEGILLLYLDGTYFMMEIKNPCAEFKISGKEISKTYVACFYSESVSWLGVGEVKNAGEIIQKFEKKKEEYFQNKRYEKEHEGDINFVLDKMMEKMFDRPSTSFFEHTKNQLYSLFSSSSRAIELEKIIPSSKFIETDSEGERAYLGIVYKRGIPFAIGVGYGLESPLGLKSENSYQYFYDGLKSNKGYFVSFRRASDGDRVEIK